MAKLTLTDISAGYLSIATYNANNTLIETALENTLSRDGTSPNTMSVDLDMNSNNINNVTDATLQQQAVTLAQLEGATFVFSSVSDASDVDTTGVTANDLLYFNGTNWIDTATLLTFDGTNLVHGTFRSIAAGSGGFEVNNTSTGAGFERVLTASDLSSLKSGTAVDNQLAVWVSANAIEGDANLTYDGALQKLLVDGVVNMVERAAAIADVATQGQHWVRSDAPNVPMFTDDAGTDQLIDPSASELNVQNVSYTLLITDKGKTISKESGGAGETITIPANASVAFPIGTFIGFNNDGGGDLSIAITTDTLTWVDDNTTGTRTLADGGAAVAQKVTATAWKIAGSAMT